MHEKSRRNVFWWRPDMVDGAEFSENDIPMCPTTAKDLPTMIVTYKEAKEIYRRRLRNGREIFRHFAYVCFYEDDYDFDSSKGIWFPGDQDCKILKCFQGVITPDFSTYQDFPDPYKRLNTYRMRAFGYWYGTLCGGSVINNVRWGTPETYEYCFDGIPKNSIVAIGTVGGSPRKLADRSRFENGLAEMIKRLSPHTILVYGSANYKCFNELEKRGIRVIDFPSKTSRAFGRRPKR